jgi:hypothetical protein
VLAIGIHNLPEGIAAGVGFGTGNTGEALTIALGIALQNIPEGMVIIGPMLAAGISHGRTFFAALLTGLVEVVGTLLGYFAVSVSAVDEVGDGVNLKRLRAVFPNGCARIFIGRPIYSAEGGFIGFIRDVEMHDFAVTRLFSDRDEIFPVTAIAACADAVILRKEQSFPIGQRVPAPLLSSKNEPIVTISVLRKAIAKGELIKLTLALSPFRLELC